MADDKKISFQAADNGVTNFIKRLQADSKSLYSDMLKEAQKQTASQKEQLKIIDQQIKQLERQNRLEKEQNQLLLERRRAVGTIDKSGYSSGLAEIREGDLTNKVQTNLLKDMLEEMKGQKEEDKVQSPASAKQVVGAILTAGIIRDIWGMVRGLPGAKSEFDLVTPFASGVGTMAGMALGAPLGYLSPGLPAAVTQAGKELGGFAGSGYTRHLTESQRYLGAGLHVGGLTGQREMGVTLNDFGKTLTESLQLQEQLVRAVGGKVGADQIRNVAAISRAYSIDSGVLAQYMGGSRMGAKTNETQIAEFIAQGIDQSRLTDALSASTALLQVMGATTVSPSRLATNQMLTEFNDIGGPFSIGDPRSVGLISQIQSSMVSPSSPFAQAMSYSNLRRMNPNAGMLDLMIERQKGGPLQLREMMDSISAMGGSEDFQVMMFAQQAGLTQNLGAARKLFQGREKIAAGGMQIADMGAEDLQKLYQSARESTSEIDRSQAAVTDAFVRGFTDGITELAIRFTDKMSDAIDEFISRKLTPNVNSAQSNAQSKVPNKGGRFR